MNIYWQKIVFKILCWLAVEAIFNLIGIDDLVDYSEFLFVPREIVQVERFSFFN